MQDFEKNALDFNLDLINLENEMTVMEEKRPEQPPGFKIQEMLEKWNKDLPKTDDEELHKYAVLSIPIF